MQNLKITASGSIELRAGDYLVWESNAPDAYSEYKQGDSLEIKQVNLGGSTININTGNKFQTVVTSGNSIVIGDVIRGGTVISGSSGGVWINGKRIDIQEDSDRPAQETPHLIVYVPKGTNVDIKTSGSTDVFGNAEIGALSVKTAGSSDINLSCNSAQLRTSGSSSIFLSLGNGGLQSDFSGSTNLKINQR